jgi:Domain of unknown function (DUF4340)
MNNETKTTLYFVCAAVLLSLIAFAMSPKRITPESFADQGQAFFPDFTDPNVATTLEVIEYDTATASPVPFKVSFKDGRWTIPSHYDYPADGKDRLAKTAAGVIDVKKDDLRSTNSADQEACGVIDPSEATTTIRGRGTRVTLRGTGDQILADFIVGKPVEGREGFRFVRVPGTNRIYACRMNIELSTKFEDWIETDLLKVVKTKITDVTLRDYSINERTNSVDQRENVTLSLSGGKWEMKGAKGAKPDSVKVDSLLKTLDDLRIVGVRTKPAGLTANLTGDKAAISQQDIMSLQSRGYYLSRDGQLLSNEGELIVETSEGVAYTLRFGEVVYGTGTAVSAGSDGSDSKGGQGENRYLFVTASFESKNLTPPQKPTNTSFQNKPDSLLTEEDRANKSLQSAFDEWQRNVDNGRKIASDLNDRFAKWYYVISSKAFEALHLSRKDLASK